MLTFLFYSVIERIKPVTVYLQLQKNKFLFIIEYDADIIFLIIAGSQRNRMKCIVYKAQIVNELKV